MIHKIINYEMISEIMQLSIKLWHHHTDKIQRKSIRRLKKKKSNISLNFMNEKGALTLAHSRINHWNDV